MMDGVRGLHLRGDGGQRVGDALRAVQAAVHVQHEVVERRAAQLRAGHTRSLLRFLRVRV
jgi:hypothetical protein